MIGGGKCLGSDEIIRQRRIRAEADLEFAQGIIFHHLFGLAAVRLQHLAAIAEGEDRLDSAGDIVGEQRNRAGGSDRSEQGIADAMLGDGAANICRQRRNVGPCQIGVAVEQRKGALFARQRRRSAIGRLVQGAQPGLNQGDAFLRTIARLAEDQRIGQARDPKPEPALGDGFLALRIQRKARHINGVIQHPHGDAGQPFQLGHVQPRIVFKRIAHQLGQIDRPQQAGAIGRQRLLAARIGGADGLAIGKIVLAVDAVNEDHPRLGIVIGGAHDAVPQGPRLHGAIHLAAEFQGPVAVCFHRRHEGVRHQHRQIEIGKPPAAALGVNKIFDIGMIDRQGRHHGAAPCARAHDGAAHRIPHFHEGHGPRGIRPHAFDQRALGPQGGKVIADAAALLQRQRRFAQRAEDAVHGIGDGAHDKAVEQSDGALRARTRQDAPGRQEFVPRQGRSKVLGMGQARRWRLGQAQGIGHARPAIRHVAVTRAFGRPEAVFHVPDMAGNFAHHSSTNHITDGCATLAPTLA